jgi:8-oxo-dGTP diphosphatase
MRKIDEEVHQLLEHFSEKLPHFSDGRIDYSYTDTAPVLTVFIAFQQQLLLLKRSDKVRTYKEKWNTVAGYLDNPNQTLFEKILEELQEELDVNKDQIASYSLGQKYKFTDKNNGKIWIVHPVLVTLSEKPKITLNWEHTAYTWVTTDSIYDYETVPNLKESMKRALKLASN